MMFDNFQAYDVQETRRVSREEGRIEGKIEDEQLLLIKLVIKKLEKITLLNKLLKFLKNLWIPFSQSMISPYVRHLIIILIKFLKS